MWNKKKTACFKCKLPCKNLKNHVNCFLCPKRCHVECATEKKNLMNIKKVFVNYIAMAVKIISLLYRVSIILIIILLDLINLLLLKEKDKCYLDFNNVKFGNINSISVVYMIIRSLNANRYKNGEFLNSVEGLPDVICVYETCLLVWDLLLVNWRVRSWWTELFKVINLKVLLSLWKFVLTMRL